MKLTAYLFLLPLAASSVLLSACGGAADGGPVVTNMLATTPRFSQVMTITVAGQALDLGIEVAVDGGPCANLTASAGATATSAQYTCVVNGVGNLVPRVRNTTSRRELASLQLTVPMPQVTVAVTQGSRSGSFIVELDPVKAPLSTNNFLAYVNSAFYTNVIFHRVIDNFVVQAGGFTSGPSGPVAKTGLLAPIALESNNGLQNVRGTIAMARVAARDSATSQFYVNVADNPSLDVGSAENPDGYAVFGKVVQGMDVVDEIKIVPTFNNGAAFPALPLTDVKITSARQTQ